jgi:hypothetical protein
MAKRLVEGELAAVDGHGTVLGADRTECATIRAGLLWGEGLGLLLQEGGEGALGQATSSGRGDFLHGLEVDRAVGARLAEDATSDDFSPPSGQVLDLLEFLRREGAL